MTRRFRVLAALLVLFAVWIFFAPILATNLIIEKPLVKADAIMVLSGSSVYRERTHKAAELYRQAVAEKIILTDDGGLAGWSQKEERNPPFVDLARQELIAQGVPEEDIEVLRPKVSGTIQEAELLRENTRKEHWRAVLLVTSAYHTKRALRTFSEVLDKDCEIGIASPPAGIDTPSPEIWWLSPQGWNMVAGEYVKSLGYWLYY